MSRAGRRRSDEFFRLNRFIGVAGYFLLFVGGVALFTWLFFSFLPAAVDAEMGSWEEGVYVSWQG